MQADPTSLLLPYQAQIVHAPGRFLAACFARQTGKSFSVACRVARRLISIPRLTVLIAAPSLRQSLESLDKVKDWLRAYTCAFNYILEEWTDVEKGFKAGVVTLPNASRCVAVPGRPDTVRGFSGDIWLDEFAFFDDPDATWRAIVPTITNSLRGGQKHVTITSTPNGKGGKGKRFYNIIHGHTKGTWTTYTIPLRTAIAQGLPTNYAEMADLLDDPIAQAQELDCQFLDDTNELLPLELIAAATSAQATTAPGADYWATARGKDIRLGIDFGRSNDPTVCWALERSGDLWITREVLVLKNTPAPRQEEILRTRIAAARRVCYDYTGPGIGTGDHLAEEFGQWKPQSHQFGKIELCTFTLALKREIFPRLRRAMESPVTLRIPPGDAIRDDLHAMQQIIHNGEYTYSAPRTAQGHSDRCTALALALRATTGATAIHPPVPIPRRTTTQTRPF